MTCPGTPAPADCVCLIKQALQAIVTAEPGRRVIECNEAYCTGCTHESWCGRAHPAAGACAAPLHSSAHFRSRDYPASPRACRRWPSFGWNLTEDSVNAYWPAAFPGVDEMRFSWSLGAPGRARPGPAAPRPGAGIPQKPLSPLNSPPRSPRPPPPRSPPSRSERRRRRHRLRRRAGRRAADPRHGPRPGPPLGLRALRSRDVPGREHHRSLGGGAGAKRGRRDRSALRAAPRGTVPHCEQLLSRNTCCRKKCTPVGACVFEQTAETKRAVGSFPTQPMMGEKCVHARLSGRGFASDPRPQPPPVATNPHHHPLSAGGAGGAPAFSAAALSAAASAEIRLDIPDGPLRFFQRAEALEREDEGGSGDGGADSSDSSRTCHLDNPHLARSRTPTTPVIPETPSAGGPTLAFPQSLSGDRSSAAAPSRAFHASFPLPTAVV